jgi:hypothetical protein
MVVTNRRYSMPILARDWDVSNPIARILRRVLRLPRRGEIDHAFGSNGRVTTNFFNGNEIVPGQDSNDMLRFVGADSQGRILAVGHAASSYHCRGEIAVSRYTADGQPDTTFGSLDSPERPTGDNTTRTTFGRPIGGNSELPDLPGVPEETKELLIGSNPWSVGPVAGVELQRAAAVRRPELEQVEQ